MLIWREGKAKKRPGIWTWSKFLGQFYPRAIIGQKTTNSSPLQLRLEVKCVSLKEATHQRFEKAASVYFNSCQVKMLRRNVTSQTSQKNVFHLHS